MYKSYAEFEDALHKDFVLRKCFDKAQTKERQVTEYKDTVDPEHAGC